MFDSNTMDSGSHSRHLAYDLKTGGAKPFKCVICHKWNTSAALTDCDQCHLVEATKHANFSIDINFDSTFATSGSYNGSPTPVSKTPGSAYGSCVTIYCHSNGTSVSTGTIPANMTPAWGSGTLACYSCHGNGIDNSMPNYDNGSPKANSHSAHSAKTCDNCLSPNN
jgi:predicted CxxxxCH...CXXCH cytochrome family protein